MTTGGQSEKGANGTATEASLISEEKRGRKWAGSLTGPQAGGNFGPCTSVPQSLLRGEAYCSALWAALWEEGPGAPRRGLEWKHALHTRGWGCITYTGVCTSKNFGPGCVEVGRVLEQMPLANQVGFEEVISNDSNDA